MTTQNQRQRIGMQFANGARDHAVDRFTEGRFARGVFRGKSVEILLYIEANDGYSIGGYSARQLFVRLPEADVISEEDEHSMCITGRRIEVEWKRTERTVARNVSRLRAGTADNRYGNSKAE